MKTKKKRSQTIAKLLESSSDEEDSRTKSPLRKTKKEKSISKTEPTIVLKGRVDVEESPENLVELMTSPRVDKSNDEILSGLKKISTPRSKSPRTVTETEMKNSLSELRLKYENQLKEARKELKELQKENEELRETKESNNSPQVTTGLMTPRSQSENELRSVKRKLREADGKNKDLLEDLELMKELVNEKLETKKTLEEMKRDAQFKREQAKFERDDKMQSKLLTKDFMKKEQEYEEKIKKEEGKWKRKCKELEEYYEQEKEELEEKYTKSKEKEKKLKEKLTTVLEERDELLIKLEKYENKILKSKEVEMKITEELKEKQDENETLNQKIEKFEEKQEELWKENNFLKKTKDVTDGYDQINMPRPPNAPPLNLPKRSIYPGSSGMVDLLAEIKKGIALRKGQIVDKGDFKMPVEVDIAEQCASGLFSLKKTAWRKSMQRGDPLIIEKVAK
eukprot:gene7184-11496_t